MATRAASLRLESATVSPVGVESASPLAVKPGETVRVSWGTFQNWGLVVRGTPSVQIRFAGLVHEEEGKIREWAAAQGCAGLLRKPVEPTELLREITRCLGA